MKPLEHFETVWSRCDELATLHSYLANNVSSVLIPDELLRAEWAARVSALDLYVHEFVAQGMLAIFEGSRPSCPAYSRFRLAAETVDRIRKAQTQTDASAAFDLDVRTQLGLLSYQEPDKIADGIRLCSPVELWNEVALALGASPATKVDDAKKLRRQLSIIVQRRNRIAHEGDLQPTPLREPWPIAKADLIFVGQTIRTVVEAIDQVA